MGIIMHLFTGSGVAIVTPMDEHGGIDYNVLGLLIEFHLSNKTDAIIINGTTGESATLSTQEQIDIIDFTVQKVNGAIPVIAGTGSNNTAAMVSLSLAAQKSGVDGLLCVTPYYLKTTQAGLIEHFRAVHDATTLPIILYNVPGRTNINLLPETVLELSNFERIVGLKEASGDLGQVAEVLALCGPNFSVYSGNDDSIIPLLSLGGVGVISVLANILPLETHQMVADYLSGNIQAAKEQQLHYKHLIDALFEEPSPIPVKKALSLMGYESQDLRLPLVSCTDGLTQKLHKLMKDVDLI